MAEMVVSASEFRVFFKDLANSTAAEQHRLVITRHGHKLVALVSQEDLEFLRKHKPQPTSHPVPDPVEDPLEGAGHPETMETADIERIYRATRDSTDEEVIAWRAKAWLVLRLRTGKYPADLPDPRLRALVESVAKPANDGG